MGDIQPLPRRRAVIQADINVQRALVEYLRDLALEFVQLDQRPLHVSVAGVHRVGPSPIPDDLQQNFAAESAKLRALELEHDASFRN